MPDQIPQRRSLSDRRGRPNQNPLTYFSWKPLGIHAIEQVLAAQRTDDFLRRFGAVVEFQMPSPTQRELLWHKAIPREAPKHDDLDIERLAKQFVLAGGSIVNAAINACVLAAQDDSPVAMKHAVRAVGKELIKMGKQVNRVHFGEFYDEVADL